MSKIELIKRYVFFTVGLFLASFGVALITKANLGTSPISSIPYVLSLKYAPTLGQFTIYFSVLLVILQILILRRNFKLVGLLQIPVSIAFGYFIDWSMLILGFLNPQQYAFKVISLIIGCLVLGFGVFMEFAANVVMLPGEAFVSAWSQTFKTDKGITKIVFDTSMTLCAALMALLLFHRLEGVREGTLISALLVGAIARFFMRKLAFIEKIFKSGKDGAEMNL